MILFNTSFHLATEAEDDFIEWVRREYMPTAQCTEGFSDITFARMLVECQPGTAGYCFQMKCESIEVAAAWHDGPAAALRTALHSRWGDRLLDFTTYMEIVPL